MAVMVEVTRATDSALKIILGTNRNSDIFLEDEWNICNSENSDLHLACVDGDLTTTESLIENGCDLNTPNRLGITPLMLAAVAGHSDCVQVLLKHRAKTELRNQWNQTVLMLTAYSGETRCVELLVHARANLEAEDNDGKTVMMYAAEGGHAEVINLLIDAGTDTYRLDNNYRAAFDYLAKHLNVSKYHDSCTLLQFFVKEKDIVRVKHILNHFHSDPVASDTELLSEYVNRCDGVGNQAIHYALDVKTDKKYRTARKIAELLLDAGARMPRALNSERKTLICCYIEHCESELEIQILLRRIHSKPALTTVNGDVLTPSDEVFLNPLLPNGIESHNHFGPIFEANASRTSVRNRLTTRLEPYRTLKKSIIQAVIQVEDEFHESDLMKMKCLRETLGPNHLTVEINDVLEPLVLCQNAVIEWVVKVWVSYRETVFVMMLIYSLSPLVGYYFDFVTDVLLALEITEGPYPYILIFTCWFVSVIMNAALNIYLFFNRTKIFEKSCGNNDRLVTYMRLRFRLFRSVIAPNANAAVLFLFLLLQLWPATMYLCLAYIIYDVRKFCIDKETQATILNVIERFCYNLNVIGKVNTVIEATAQLLIVLCISDTMDLSFSMISKLISTPLFVSLCLLKDEVRVKYPVEYDVGGYILLFLTLALRYLGRLLTFMVFIRSYGFWILAFFVVHVFVVMMIQASDAKKYETSLGRMVRFREACFSLFNFVPEKTYDHDGSAVGRVVYIILIISEDVIMLVAALASGRDPHYGRNPKIIGSVVICHIASLVFLILYYKFCHPWKWRFQLHRNKSSLFAEGDTAQLFSEGCSIVIR